MESGYPLYTEIKQSLATCLGLTCSSKVLRPSKYFAFGTETSVIPNIPHYQCWSIYPALIRRTSVYEFLQDIFGDRAHIAVTPVFGKAIFEKISSF